MRGNQRRVGEGLDSGVKGISGRNGVPLGGKYFEKGMTAVSKAAEV